MIMPSACRTDTRPYPISSRIAPNGQSTPKALNRQDYDMFRESIEDE